MSSGYTKSDSLDSELADTLNNISGLKKAEMAK